MKTSPVLAVRGVHPLVHSICKHQKDLISLTLQVDEGSSLLDTSQSARSTNISLLDYSKAPRGHLASASIASATKVASLTSSVQRSAANFALSPTLAYRTG
nr:hypothetical protein CFP56_64815 [Quercus suber]